MRGLSSKLLCSVGALTAIAAFAAGCGSDDEGDATPANTGTVPVTQATTTPATTTQSPNSGSNSGSSGGGTQQPSNGETADLPLCSEGPPPCRAPDGSVREPQGGGAGSGEISDLPLCSTAPRPCRQADGSVLEP